MNGRQDVLALPHGGLGTPADLSVVGYDAFAVAQWSRPAPAR